MHKIKKFQWPSTGITFTPDYVDPYTKYLNDQLKKSSELSKSVLPDPFTVSKTPKTSTDIFKSTQLLNKWTDSGKVQGKSIGDTLKGGLKSFGTQLKTDVLGQAPQLAESALGMIGVKKADVISGGEQIFSKGADLAFQAGLKTGNPALIGPAALAKGLDFINQYGGKSAKKQGTIGLSTGPYDFKTSSLAGQKFTLLGGGRRKKVDALTKRVDTENLMAANAAYKAQQENLAISNSWGDLADANQQRLSGGLDTRILSVKLGTKINPSKLRNIAKKVKGNSKKEDVEKFENGGKMNVIPDGALHARLNHLDEELGVTSKGIPVVTFDDGGEITQHAEIEINEIIFNKDTTDQIEHYFKLYKKAESEQEKNKIAVECGKFLVEEILENTDDRTGLIEEVE